MAGIFASGVYDLFYDESYVQKRREAASNPVLFPPRIEDYVGPDNPVRAIDSFVNVLDLAKLGFRHADRARGWDNRLTTRPIC